MAPIAWTLWLCGLPFALIFVAAGRGHFAQSRKFVGIMRGLPAPALHMAANYATGAAEIVLGVALATAPLAGSPARAALIARALFWLVVLMTPANINMLVNDVPFGRVRLTYGLTGTHAVRLALQAALLLCLHRLEAAWRAA